MSKYDPLWNFIETQHQPQVKLTFDEIKDILGFEIDHSFLTYKKELLSYGFQVDNISLKNKTMVISTMVTTDRLTIFPLSNEQMQRMIKKEPDEELKQVYSEMLAGCKANPKQRVWFALWVMKLKNDNQTIGNLCFKGLDDSGMVEIGYGINPEYENKGLTTEAVTALARWASRQAGVKSVESETAPDNMASQKVLLKSGFLPTGTMGEEGPRYIFSKLPQ